ncbi:Csu type fimbrial protein [Kosakonia sacchari]|uniref:Spore coat protein U (SCPU) domain-containing protein n=1 Tax=Kosakonia sacchari TaxID=1158459 RepID=A0A1G4YG18_9ENTR|nr:spore coat U domain-containing protein [Kosakonia sacchari]AIA25022.1 fimbrial protein [Kosakonia sacchari SP1]NUL39166.1 spore coat protein U domain-containing protein [Kosakonia sacchari]SCX51718.1 Spore coat protein U (SCPU) domain-containing protein [Kosakonia sacchari]
MRRLLLLLLLLSCGPAWSACTVSTTNGAFGSVTSFVLNATAQNTTASLIVRCDAALNLLTNDSITLTLTGASATASNRGVMKRSDNAAVTDAIPIRVCGQANCANNSEATISGNSYTWSGAVLLALLGTRTYTLPLYFLTVPGQNVSAGPYTVTLNFSVAYNVCSVGVLGSCSTAQTGTATTSLQVNGTVTNDCTTISAPNVNFGSAPLVRNFPTISQSVAITCTKGMVYTVGINNGGYYNGSARNMASGSNRLSYEIYKGATTNRWGSAGAERWSSGVSSQVSSDGLLRTYNYTAQILTSQTTPPGGTYSDTLTVDIAF